MELFVKTVVYFIAIIMNFFLSEEKMKRINLKIIFKAISKHF